MTAVLTVLIDAPLYVKNASDRPAGMEALRNQALVNPQNLSPLRNGQRLPGMRQPHACAAIVSLSSAGGPYAIIRLIVAIIIESLKRMSCWRLAHVSEEVFELSPSGAYVDTSAAIAIKAICGRVAASFFHVQPCFVCRRSTHSMSLAAIRCQLAPQTAAGFSFPATQGTGGCLCGATAVTCACPARAASLGISGQFLDGNQAGESITYADKVLH